MMERSIILEDIPAYSFGVSYMIENREITKRIFPIFIPQNNVRPGYASILTFCIVTWSHCPRVRFANPTVVLLTPGVYNSALFRAYYTRPPDGGRPCVRGRDLIVDNHRVFMKTTVGLQQVDVIYRRVDDHFLDPLVFNPEVRWVVSGILSAYRKGNVAIVNALGKARC